MEHRKCPSCKEHWHSSEGQAVWKCECGAEILGEQEAKGMFITNFVKTDTDLYKKAIAIYKKRTGDDVLFIDDNAYWSNGTKDESMSALRLSENKDLSVFWRIFDGLRKKEEERYETNPTPTI